MKNTLLTLLILSLLTPMARAQEAIPYKEADGKQLVLQVFKPEGWKASDKRPGFVFFHGGGWTGGTPTALYPQAKALAARGMVAISAQYRLAEKGKAPESSVNDARSAMRWVRSHAAELGINPTRLGAGGGSAGGHLAAHCGMINGLDDPKDDKAISCRPDALVLLNPVYDNGPGGYGNERIGERFKEFSPFHNIGKDSPPTLVFFGDMDKLVPVKTAEAFRDAQRAAGVKSELIVSLGQAHGFFNKEPYLSKTIAEMEGFLERLGWLKKQSKPAPALRPITETPGLPRVLLIGDSISMGYTLPVRNLLDGKANVIHPPVNCSDSGFGLRELDKWLGDKPWDVIHVNFGLHDLKFVDEKGTLVAVEKGKQRLSLTEYEANLRALVARLKATKAKLIWATTTTVPEGTIGRIAGGERAYNEIVKKVMTELKVPIDDLHAVMAEQQPRNVHFTPAGYETLAQAVVRSLSKAL
ncbi:alpha/beta hydrolase fold domain-containing protein [Armatimonas sp.]|uniref:alpha/beta hydrolase fold domain-containing protein n=1 Tax=Armatimonas sp. TaxID=1872638 RepID=UPI00286A039D|nr:alpha/beta hydrolase fold domain-containing protein [Armatimonas sp.]